MAATLTDPTPVDEHVDLRTGVLSKGRRRKDRLATAFMVGSFLIALIPLIAVIGTVVVKGISAIGPDWFSKPIPDVATNVLAGNAAEFGIEAPAEVGTTVYGMQPAIVGTLITTGIAAALAIPVGILGAVYLNEYGKTNRLAKVIRFLTDVMTGVPSVVMGVFIYTVYVVPRGTEGRAALAGGLALACLMLPVVVRSTEEMLRLVPNNLREASLALGTRTWRTTISVVLPAALPGITSGCMLAIARAAGETAPLLLTIGSTRFTNWSLSGVNTALSTQIYGNATQPGGDPLAWGAALTLIAIVLVFTLLARFVTSRFSLASA